MKVRRWIIYLALAGFALVSCAQVFPTVAVSELPTQAPTAIEQIIEPLETPTEVAESAMEAIPTAVTTPTEAAEMVSTETTSGEITPTEEATTEIPVALPTETPVGTTALGSSELHATNPANVNLASGKVQLVEFFAFW